MAAWAVCALCAVVILKPQEFVGALTGVPLVYGLFGVAIALMVVDVIWRRLRPAVAPQVPWLLAFAAWGVLTTAIKSPDALEDELVPLLILLSVFAVTALGVGSARGVRLFAMAYVACAVTVSVVAVIQADAPFGCMLGAPDDW